VALCAPPGSDYHQQELEVLDDDDTTCAADDGNSAHLDGERLCLVAPAP
jgi:hypothetical protein